MTDQSEYVRIAVGQEPAPSVREAVIRLNAILRECAEDDEKRKLYFGYFETSLGDL